MRVLRLGVVAMLAAFAGAPRAHASACAAPVGLTQLTAALDAAEASFAAREAPAFQVASDRARADLPCLDAALSPALAARYHRAEGLRAFLDRDTLATSLSFATVRAIEPAASLPTTLAPEGHPLQALFGAAVPGTVALAPVPRPALGTLLLDGRPASTRATDRPSIAQLVLPDGGVELTRYLRPGEALPQLGPPPVPEVATPSLPAAPPPPRPGPGRALLVGGAAGLVGGGLLYGAALVTHDQYDAMTDGEKREAAQLVATNHGLVVASGVLGGAGVLAGVMGAVTVAW